MNIHDQVNKLLKSQLVDLVASQINSLALYTQQLNSIMEKAESETFVNESAAQWMTARIKLLLSDKIFKSELPDSQAKTRKTVTKDETAATKSFKLTDDEHSDSDSLGTVNLRRQYKLPPGIPMFMVERVTIGFFASTINLMLVEFPMRWC